MKNAANFYGLLDELCWFKKKILKFMLQHFLTCTGNKPYLPFVVVGTEARALHDCQATELPPVPLVHRFTVGSELHSQVPKAKALLTKYSLTWRDAARLAGSGAPWHGV